MSIRSRSHGADGADDRVVITGVGAVSPVGLCAPASFGALVEGVSGVDLLFPDLDDSFEVRIGARVKGFESAAVLGKKHARRHGRFTQLASAAAYEAIQDAQLAEAGYASDRIATVVGVGFGGLELLEEGHDTLRERGPARVSPYAIAGLIPNMAAGVVAMLAEAKGPCFCTASACASSSHALGEALQLLRRGAADAVIAGGAESCMTPLCVAGFARMGALSKRNDSPREASRPFDKDRDGFVIGEGAAFVILERLEVARRRGAVIYAELAGAGSSADAYHVTLSSEDGSGAALSMTLAMQDARIDPGEIGYVSAHGTSTPHNDVTETKAIRRAFGHHADSLWVSSTKSMTGHLLGAAGAFAAVATTLALHKGVVPPTINMQEAGVGCDLDFVPGQARERRLDAALCNAFGFGGQNSTLVLRAAR